MACVNEAAVCLWDFFFLISTLCEDAESWSQLQALSPSSFLPHVYSFWHRRDGSGCHVQLSVTSDFRTVKLFCWQQAVKGMTIRCVNTGRMRRCVWSWRELCHCMKRILFFPYETAESKRHSNWQFQIPWGEHFPCCEWDSWLNLHFHSEGIVAKRKRQQNPRQFLIDFCTCLFCFHLMSWLLSPDPSGTCV